LTFWLREITKKIENCGMDTVFRVYDPTKPTQEQYLLTSWNNISDEDFDEWMKALQTDGVRKATGGQNHPVCDWDLDNLTWSGEMLKDSISDKLWMDIVSLLPSETGPHIFMAIVDRVKYTSASTTRNLIKQLESLSLTKEPGMDVTTFSIKVLNKIEKIEQCDESTFPPDLSLVTAGRFLHTGVSMFDQDAVQYFNLCNKNLKAMTPRKIIESLKNKYIGLVGLGEWPHKSQKDNNAEMTALYAKLNTLQQKFDSYKGPNPSNTRGASQSGGTVDLSEVTCHGCGQKGHYKNKCPNAKPATYTSSTPTTATSPPPSFGPHPEWMLKGPGPGESEVKMLEGVEYTWCSKCKLGKDQKTMWRQGIK
jgi:hypothetical protein